MATEQPRTNRQWIIHSRLEESLDPSIFEKREVPVPELAMGQVLASTLYLSFDPTQRRWLTMDTFLPAFRCPPGEIMKAMGVAQIVESKNARFKPGDLVFGFTMWQEHIIFDPDESVFFKFRKLPGHIDPERALSLMVTGISAYFGMLDIGKPIAGDTVIVSGAAGATGSFAGQIAKLKGCRVIGIAGGPEKCKWLVEKGHFDAAIDYKNDNVPTKIKELCPDGVNVFFDNVGGEILDAVLVNLAMNARIVLCGGISQYGKKAEDVYGVKNLMQLVGKRGILQGFIVVDYESRFTEAMVCLNKWIDDGKIVYEVDVQTGFDEIPNTLMRLFTGKNLGKQVLKLSDPTLPVSTSTIEQAAMKIMGIFYDYWQT